MIEMPKSISTIGNDVFYGLRFQISQSLCSEKGSLHCYKYRQCKNKVRIKQEASKRRILARQNPKIQMSSRHARIVKISKDDH
jgi:hypothetical protein